MISDHKVVVAVVVVVVHLKNEQSNRNPLSSPVSQATTQAVPPNCESYVLIDVVEITNTLRLQLLAKALAGQSLKARRCCISLTARLINKEVRGDHQLVTASE
eukprot:4799268-Amphidinium_carterae.1